MQQLIVNANTPWPAQLPIWITPYGFLRQAAASNATLKSETCGGKKYTVVTFIAPNKAKVNGYIGADNMVDKVETWMDTMLGDTLYEATYSGYKDFGGVKVPTRMVEKQASYPTLEMMVTMRRSTRRRTSRRLSAVEVLRAVAAVRPPDPRHKSLLTASF
jgi:hypothetical protein